MRLSVLILLVLALAGVGCDKKRDGQYAKPTIAVLKFENRASFPYRWDIGGGTRDVLVDRLMKTKRFQVVERPEIEGVVRELEFQNSGWTREQQRARLGQIKNVQYLVKGTITDFGHVASATLYGRKGGWGGSASGNVAIMSMVLYVIHVESGEIICSERIEQAVSTNSLDMRGTYKDISFGGSVFAKTPMGKVMDKALDRAVDRISDVIAMRPWTPRIAALNADGTIVLNGGKDRSIGKNEIYVIMRPGAVIVDPETGDQIGQMPGKVAGRLRVREVKPNHAIAEVLEGDIRQLTIGMACERER